MRRVLSFVLTLVMLIGMVSQFAMLTKAEETETTEPTCTKQGYTSHTCSCTDCDEALTGLVILKQPEDTTAFLGENVTVSVEAFGNSVSYTWYFKDAKSSAFSKSSIKTSTYTIAATAARDGRQVYCVVKDKAGNTVTSDIVTLRVQPKVELKLLSQPTFGSVDVGETINVTMAVQGDGLKYAWYCRNAGSADWYKSSIKSASYSVKLTKAVMGREIYCVITDALGNSVTTESVILNTNPEKPLRINAQPSYETVKLDEEIQVTLGVQGNYLTYAWYCCNAGSTSWYKSSIREASYCVTMTKAVLGRQVYCVITDALGNKVTTDTITLSAVPNAPLAILRQPEYGSVALGEKINVTMNVQGDYLTYAWYCRNAGSNSWYKSSIKSADYSVDLTKAVLGREIYCVITDAFGSQVTTETVILGEKQEEVPIVVTRSVPLVESAKEVLPAYTMADAPAVALSSAPYALTDTSRFAGKKITKIGIPVKEVDLSNGAPVFTLSVVHTDVNTNAYSYIAQYPLELNITEETVNDWVYVDVSNLNLQLAENETLAFGAPKDTVLWAYIGASIDNRYTFRSTKSNWSVVNGNSIVFDVYAEEVLEFAKVNGEQQATTEVAVPGDVKTILAAGSLKSASKATLTNAPFSYLNTPAQYEGKTLTKIGIPVRSVSALDDNQTFTLSIINYANGGFEILRSYTLKLPKAQLGKSKTVNRWIYVDLTELNITVGENETLGFGAPTDTVSWCYKGQYNDSRFYFCNKIAEHVGTGIFFDVYCKDTITLEEYQAQQTKEANEAALRTLLKGKTVSILGDSISTYEKYSNNIDYNSTIGSNKTHYGSGTPIKTAGETWWMQTIGRTATALNVNNSYSGDKITEKGIARALELDNNDNLAPDIIAVYMGINDFRTGTTLATFVAAYKEMIRGMQEKYPDADIFLFTMSYTSRTTNGVDPDSVVLFNAAIKELAAEMDCVLVDIAGENGINGTNYSAYMWDGDLHPNHLGMDLITERFVDALIEKYVK